MNEIKRGSCRRFGEDISMFPGDAVDDLVIIKANDPVLFSMLMIDKSVGEQYRIRMENHGFITGNIREIREIVVSSGWDGIP